MEKLLAANLLTIQEKEVYYSEVKNLIKIIKWNQSRYMADKLRKKRVSSQMKQRGITLDVEMISEDSEEEKQSVRSSKRSSSLYKVKDAYLTKEEFNIATGKGLSSRY